MKKNIFKFLWVLGLFLWVTGLGQMLFAADEPLSKFVNNPKEIKTNSNPKDSLFIDGNTIAWRERPVGSYYKYAPGDIMVSKNGASPINLTTTYDKYVNYPIVTRNRVFWYDHGNGGIREYNILENTSRDIEVYHTDYIIEHMTAEDNMVFWISRDENYQYYINGYDIESQNLISNFLPEMASSYIALKVVNGKVIFWNERSFNTFIWEPPYSSAPKLMADRVRRVDLDSKRVIMHRPDDPPGLFSYHQGNIELISISYNYLHTIEDLNIVNGSSDYLSWRGNSSDNEYNRVLCAKFKTDNSLDVVEDISGPYESGHTYWTGGLKKGGQYLTWIRVDMDESYNKSSKIHLWRNGLQTDFVIDDIIEPNGQRSALSKGYVAWIDDEQDVNFTQFDKPPVLHLSGTATSNVWSQNNVTVVAAIDDDYDDINSCQVRYVKTGDETGTGSSDRVTVTTEGTTTITYTVTDGAGSTVTGTYIVKIDRTAPAMSVNSFSLDPPTIEFGGDKHTNADQVDIHIDLSDALSGVQRVEYKINNSAFTPIYGKILSLTGMIDTAKKNNGVIELAFAAKDYAGNRTGNLYRVLRVDADMPSITISPYPDIKSGQWWTQDMKVDLVATAKDTSGLDWDTWRYTVKNLGTSKEIDSGSSRITTIADDGKYKVEYFVKDILGKEGNKSFEVWKDTLKPVISAENINAFNPPVQPTPEKIWIQNNDYHFYIKSLSAKDSVSGVDNSTWRYYIDGTSYELNVSNGPIICDVSAFSNQEGLHSVPIEVFDKALNYGRHYVQIYIDKTSPVISNIVYQDSGGKDLANDDYIFTNYIEAHISAFDQFMNGKNYRLEPGEIVSYQYIVSDQELASPDFSQAVSRPNSTFYVEGLIDKQLNHIYIAAVDGAGNYSDPVKFSVNVDTSMPAAPEKVTSTTHPVAVTTEDSYSNRYAAFLIEPAASQIQSGVKWYKYKVYTDTNPADIIYDGTTDTTLALPILKDNAADEFYLLSVQTVAGNGMESQPIARPYRFRIDSSAPKSLKVETEPYAAAGTFARTLHTKFKWQKPSDMTGISKYYYYLDDKDRTLPVTDEEKAGFDFTGWKVIEGPRDLPPQEVIYNYQTEFGSKTGHAYFFLCAEDFSLNREFTKVDMLYDNLAPVPVAFSDQKKIHFVCDKDAGTAVASFNTPVEPGPTPTQEQTEIGSGLHYYEIQLYLLGDNGPVVVADENWKRLAGTTYTFRNLSAGNNYLVRVRMVDKAGNTAIIQEAFNLIDGSISYPITLFIDEVAGYSVNGQFNTEQQSGNALLELPGVFEAREVIGNADVPIKEAAFDTVSFKNNKFVSGSCSTARTFKIKVQNYELVVNGLTLDSNGLVLGQAAYTLKDINNQNVVLTYTNVKVNGAPFYNIESSEIFTSQPFSLMTLYNNNDVIEDCWLIKDIIGSRLSDRYVMLENSKLNTSGLDIYTLDWNNNRVYHLNLTNTQIDGEKLFYSSSINETEFFIEAGSNVIKVTDAKIIESGIVVKSGKIIFDSNFTQIEVDIKGFTINKNGNITTNSDFFIGLFNFDYHGVTYHVTNAAFYGNDLVLTGYITLPGKEDVLLLFSDLTLSHEKPVFDGLSKVTNFSTDLHGFWIASKDDKSSNQAFLTANGITFPKAVLKNLHGSFGGGNHEFTGLSLSYPVTDQTPYTVVSAGTGYNVDDTDGITISDVYNEYGKVFINELELNSTGLYASKVRIDFPAFAGGAMNDFENLKLLSDGTFAASDVKTTTVTVDGFSITGNALFDGKQVIVDQGKLTHTSFTPQQLNLNSIHFNSTDFTKTGDNTTETIVFTGGSWTYNLHNFNMTKTGLICEGSLSLPASLGAGKAGLDDFVVHGNGTYDPGSIADGLNVTVSGWQATLSAISIDDNFLSAAFCSVPLLSSMGNGALDIPGISFSYDGTLASSGTGTTPVSFMSVNGFKVDGASYQFTTNGLVLNGSVYLPAVLGTDLKAVFSNNDITLGHDGNISASVSNELNTLTYSYMGWTVSASGFIFNNNGLSIVNNRILIPGTPTTVNIQNMGFQADGILKTPGISTGPVSLNFFGNKFVLNQMKLGTDGMYAQAVVTLPDNLGGTTINFDNVKFQPDGSILNTLKVPQIDFSLSEFQYQLEGIQLHKNNSTDPLQLNIDRIKITLPDYMDSKTIQADNITIDKDGTIALSTDFDSFQMWGYTFDINQLNLSSDRINMEGQVTFPSSFPGELSSAVVDIEKLEVDYSGNVEFKVRIDKTVEFPLFGDFKILGQTFAIEKVANNYLLGINTAQLIFPASFPAISRLDIKNVRINPLTGAITFDDQDLKSDEKVTLSGVDFVFKHLDIDPDLKKVTFKGFVPLPSRINSTFIEHSTLSAMSLNKLEIDANGIIRDLDAKKYIDSTYLFNSGVSLKKSTISLTKNNNDYVMNCGGIIELGSSFPGGISGKQLTIKTFKLNLTNGSLEEFSSVLGPVTFDGVLKIENAYIELKKESPGGLQVSVRGDGTNPAIVRFPSSMSNLQDVDIHLNTFTVGIDGNISEFSAGASLAQDKVIADKVLIKRGSTINISTVPDTEDFRFELAGKAGLTDDFPDGLAGIELTLKQLIINSRGNLSKMDAVVDIPSINMFGAFDVESAHIGISKYNMKQMMVEVGGDIVLPDNFPPALRGKRMAIENLEFLSTGSVLNFSADYTNINGELFSGTQLVNGAISIKNDNGYQFGVSGDIKLSGSMPGALAGAQLAIKKLNFSLNGNVLALDAQLAELSGQLLGAMKFNNCSVGLEYSNSGGYIISVAGNLKFLESMPVFADSLLRINRLKFNLDGRILAFDAVVNNLSGDLFGGLRISSGSVRIEYANNNYIFSIAGTLRLPDMLNNKQVTINELKFNLNGDLLAFSAGAEMDFEFDLFAGIKVGCSHLTISKDDFTVKGYLQFPDDFVEGLNNVRVDLDTLTMGWNGTIKKIEASLPTAQINIADFKMDLETLSFHSNGISIGKAKIYMPDSLGNKSFGLKNVRFSKDGEFYADFIAHDLNFDIVGFELKMSEPCLEIQKRQISFNSVELCLPGSLGGASTQLNGVSISSSGLEVKGAGFKLPSFEIAGGLKFMLEVNFGPDKDLGGYMITGVGEAVVPGLGGTIAVAATFSNKAAYNIKFAQFSYEMQGMGIPIGTSGIFLTGIKGSFATGTPSVYEIPDKWLRDKFGAGTRISLGISLQDSTALIKGQAQLWIDITDWDFAFKGNITLLNGFIKADVAADLIDGTFHGKVAVQVVFVRGDVEFWIWDDNNNKSRITGKAGIDFKIRKGLLVNKQTYILGRVRIPSRDIWLPGPKAEFGDFRKGNKDVRGFKGYVDVPFWGKVGAFVSTSGDLSISGISKYKLYEPPAPSLMSMSDSMYSLAAPADGSVLSNEVYLKDQSSSSETDIYNFDVPGMNDTILSAPMMEAGYVPQEKVDRIIFVAVYPEGDANLVVTSELSGVSYKEGDSNVLVERTEWGQTVAVINPEPGKWTAQVNGLPEDVPHELYVYGNTADPELTVTSPAYENMNANGTVTIEGQMAVYTGNQPEITCYISKERESYFGDSLGAPVLDQNGSFRLDFDPSGLRDGTYYIYARVEDGENPSVQAYAPGSIVIDNGGSTLTAVENVIVSDYTAEDLTDDYVVISFEDTNGKRSAGFNIYAINDGLEDKTNIGYLTEIKLPRFENGKTYQISVAAYDQYGNEGERSAPVEITMGAAKPVNNAFDFAEEQKQVRFELAKTASGTLDYTVSSPQTTNSAYDYGAVKVVSAPEWLTVNFDQTRWDLTGSTGSIEYMLNYRNVYDASGDTLPLPQPGSYNVELLFENMGNRKTADSVVLDIQMDYPAPVISNAVPNEWFIDENGPLEIYGDYFLEGSRVFIDDLELTVDEMTNSVIKTQLPQLANGGTHNIKVVGPTGKETAYQVEVIDPSYKVIGLKTKGTVLRNQQTAFYFTIRADEGFNGQASFSITNYPAGWNVALENSNIVENEECALKITVPQNQVNGQYNITIQADNGVEFDIIVDLVDTTSTPHIACLSNYTGYIGDEITIYGSGFGQAPEVVLEGHQLTLVSARSDKIVAKINNGSTSGYLKVIAHGYESNAKNFIIMQSGFNLFSREKQVTIKPGDQKALDLFVTGDDEPVQLSVTASDPQIEVVLDKTTVIPNENVNLTISADSNLELGNYTATINGESSHYSREITININVVDEIPTPTNMIINGEFNNGLNNWSFYEAGTCNFTETNNQFYADITDGGPDTWSVQLIQSSLAIEKGEFYTVSYDAKANAPRTITNFVGRASSPWTSYSGPKYQSLTTQMQTFTYDFKMGQDTDHNGRLVFDLGQSNTNVTIDNVIVYKMDTPPITIIPTVTPNPLYQTVYIGDVKSGISCIDGASGTGYIMYSAESLHTRFSSYPVKSDNSDHLIAVKYVNGSWVYDDNWNYRSFTPAEGDILIAEVDFSQDTITGLEGVSGMEHGIRKGYTESDLRFHADTLDGAYNNGEFSVTGRFFSIDKFYQTVYIGDVKSGISCIDDTSGIGYIMYSAESLHTRFSSHPVKTDNSDHLIAVKYVNGSWVYDDNWNYRSFTPQEGDVLLAEVDFTNDLIIDLAGVNEVEYGIRKGYVHGDLTFIADLLEGQANNGEFTVSGTYFYMMDNAVTSTQVENNIIVNGDFSNSITDWELYVNASAFMNTVNEELYVIISDHGPENWSIQLKQKNLLIEYGKSYRVTFDARSVSAKTITSSVSEASSPWTKYSDGDSFGLTTSMQTFSYDFTMTRSTDSGARLYFNLGQDTNDVIIDNVTLVKLE